MQMVHALSRTLLCSLRWFRLHVAKNWGWSCSSFFVFTFFPSFHPFVLYSLTSLRWSKALLKTNGWVNMGYLRIYCEKLTLTTMDKKINLNKILISFRMGSFSGFSFFQLSLYKLLTIIFLDVSREEFLNSLCFHFASSGFSSCCFQRQFMHKCKVSFPLRCVLIFKYP